MAAAARSAIEVPPAERLADPALVIVDMQNDFVRPGAPLEVPAARATVPVIAELLDRFRAKDRPIVFTRFLAEPTPSLMWLWSPQCGAALRCCWPGHPRTYADGTHASDCAGLIDALAPRPGEAVVDKTGYGAFHGTDLDRRLKAAGARSLVICGTVTHICVEETAREAFHHGWPSTVVSDAVSAVDQDLHAAALRNLAQKFCWVTTSAEILPWI